MFQLKLVVLQKVGRRAGKTICGEGDLLDVCSDYSLLHRLP